jgi:hypothetical protein
MGLRMDRPMVVGTRWAKVMETGARLSSRYTICDIGRGTAACVSIDRLQAIWTHSARS